MAITTVPAWKWPTNTPTTQKQAYTWQYTEPQKQTVDWSATNQTPYSEAEQSAIAKLADIIKYGGYSTEQKQSMLEGAMQPVYQQSEEATRKAQADAYARGLGQSGVLSRSYTDIQKGLSSSMAQLAGGIEKESAAQVMPAIQATQTGQQNLQQMMLNQAQYNANLGQQREQLAAELNMKSGDLQTAIQQINATLDMSDADRKVRLAEIQNQYQLDATKLEVLQREAEKDRIASFFSNLIGGAATVAGAALGKPPV